jgi:hypothetical protein
LLGDLALLVPLAGRLAVLEPAWTAELPRVGRPRASRRMSDRHSAQEGEYRQDRSGAGHDEAARPPTHQLLDTRTGRLDPTRIRLTRLTELTGVTQLTGLT